MSLCNYAEQTEATQVTPSAAVRSGPCTHHRVSRHSLTRAQRCTSITDTEISRSRPWYSKHELPLPVAASRPRRRKPHQSATPLHLLPPLPQLCMLQKCGSILAMGRVSEQKFDPIFIKVTKHIMLLLKWKTNNTFPVSPLLQTI